MDNYNFDMQHLLDAFGNDPEKLANAFADSLNAALAEQRKVDYVMDAAADVADAWENFVDEYFNVNELPDDLGEEDFYITPENVKSLLEMAVQAAPYITAFLGYFGKLNELTGEIKEKAPEVVQKAEDSFTDVMEKFFRNNNI